MLILACIIIYFFATVVIVKTNLKAGSFFKGFALGAGVIGAIYLVVLLIKRSKQSKTVVGEGN